MQTIYFNDQPLSVAANITLAEVLTLQGVDESSVAVVSNAQVVPRGQWQTQRCEPDDHIEVFTVVAGG